MRKRKPDCPKCKNNINVVEFPTYFRCAYCGEIINGMTGQIRLSLCLNN